jgi:hypothetical protein
MTGLADGAVLETSTAHIIVVDSRELRRAHLAAATPEIVMLTLPGVAAPRLDELPPGECLAQFSVDDVHCEGFVEERVSNGWLGCLLYLRLGGDDLPFDPLYIRVQCTWQDSGEATYAPGETIAYGKDNPSLDELRAALDPPKQS